MTGACIGIVNIKLLPRKRQLSEDSILINILFALLVGKLLQNKLYPHFPFSM
jgi:hypothetical protein